jgi:hypothetical protein
METPGWETRFKEEINQAEKARQQSNEGRARVCARRAAGIVVEEYFNRKGIKLPYGSAYDYLKYSLSSPDLSPKARLITEHLLLKVNTDYKLPIEADLIDEARKLKSELLGDNP